MKVYMPGIGGGLGQCVVCGESFVTEIMMGRSVDIIRVKGIDTDLPIHGKCKDKLPTDGDWKKLPPGPLREEFERVARELEG